jgi:protein-disulfide isomerase
VLEKNPETLKIVYKAFPLRSHKLAGPAVEGALAANLQGRFWEFHDKVFSYIYPKPGPKKLDKKELAQIPLNMGLDMARYLKDSASPAVKKLVQRDMREGRLAGVTGTPTLYLNGRRVKNRSPNGLQQMIDSELKKVKGKKKK